ncbi:PEGA domain-containing protein [Thermodesulfobacteriota bacterium]
MVNDSDGRASSFDPVPIEPVPFRSPHEGQKTNIWGLMKWVAWGSMVLVLVGLVFSAWFIFSARRVFLKIEPEPEQVTISGTILAPRFGQYFLLRPGKYILMADKPCYQQLESTFLVSGAKSQTFSFRMRKVPGKLTLLVHEKDAPHKAIENARVLIDGRDVGRTPLEAQEVPAGERLLDIRAESYLDYRGTISMQGCGNLKRVNLTLVPGWSDFFITSIPTGAKVSIDGKSKGRTPLKFRLMAGSYELQLNAKRYKVWRTRLVADANRPKELRNIRLQPADGKLTLKSSPTGAMVMVGEKYAGRTPLEVALSPTIVHVVRLSKAGYEKAIRKVKVNSDESRIMELNLKPIEGTIVFFVEPGDAELLVNGKSIGKVPRELRLTAVPQNIEVRKSGYSAYRTLITPRPGFPKELRVSLKAKEGKGEITPDMLKARNGYKLKRIRPGPFMMGASRREQGRRSNETLRKITLSRPFYLGIKEVTNSEYREFMAGYTSGSFKGVSLNDGELPVVRVTWEQAARFCNWLSEKDSLPAAYVSKDGKLAAVEPLTVGYRLPTEAEWEYCAGYSKNRSRLKYPWGGRFPPMPKSGNFADTSAKELLSNVIEGYNDGYPATGPPGQFQVNDLGLFDMGGNVAEWCHDYYSIYSYNAKKTYVDPTGPREGNLKVIRGSSWQHAGISSLRLAYRDYGNKERPDLGFRVCRYVR